MRLANGASGFIAVSRTAWGRKGRIAIQIFGAKGSILFDQERLNEFQLYLTSDRPTEAGFRTVLAAPHHKPYDRFIPAPGHELGFNDLKAIECRQLIGRILGEDTIAVTFEEGITIERAVDAMARSFKQGRWIDLADGHGRHRIDLASRPRLTGFPAPCSIPRLECRDRSFALKRLLAGASVAVRHDRRRVRRRSRSGEMGRRACRGERRDRLLECLGRRRKHQRLYRMGRRRDASSATASSSSM